MRSNWTLIVAMSRSGTIGKANSLPWHQRTDLQRFKRLTMGQCLLMGRKTYESIGRPLPGRQTIVLSHSGFAAHADGVRVVRSLEEVDVAVEAGRQVMVVGGAQLYAATIVRCSTMLITRVLADVEGDTFFPDTDWSCWQLESSQYFDAGPGDDWPTEFETWKRTQ
jgi:dihydrofolate reductase